MSVRARRPRYVRLNLEMLEGREMPSAAVGDVAADHVLVRWFDGAPTAGPVASGFTDLGNNTYSVSLARGVSVANALAYYHSLPGVDFAQPDYQIQSERTPNDPSFYLQWGLRNASQFGGKTGADIGAATAWGHATSASSVIVAVIDSGVDYNHPDLAADVWHNPGEVAGNGRDDDGDGIVDDVYGADFSTGTPTGNALDNNGHGTHVAGIIGAAGNNGIGVSGVAWNVKIMDLKFLDANGNGVTSNAVQAIYYAVNHGAKVINASWGGSAGSAALQSAIDYARAHGVIFVTSAGNNAANNDVSPAYPADYTQDNVIAVAATDWNDNLATFSNYGAKTVALAAPGSYIYSTYPTEIDAASPYRYYSGTSMAAPFVSGAMALVWGMHPEWSYSQVINDVLKTVDPLPSLSGKVKTGGRLDLAKAVAAALPTPTTPSTPSTPSQPKELSGGPAVTSVDWSGNGTSSYNRVRLTFSAAIDPATFTTADVTLTGPNGQKIAASKVTAVAGSGNKQFDVTFATRTGAGDYILSVGPDVRDTQGRLMDQNKNGTAGESGDVFTTKFTVSGSVNLYSGNVNGKITAGLTATATLVVSTHLTLSDLNVKLNVSYAGDSDLTIKLVAPNGKEVILANRRGGSGRGYSFTVFDDQAATAISSGTAPFTGNFRPDGSLSSLNGIDLYGTWKIVVTNAGKGVGSIQNFTLIATTSGGTPGVKAVGEEVGSPEATTAPADSAATVPTTVQSQSISSALSGGIAWVSPSSDETTNARANEIKGHTTVERPDVIPPTPSVVQDPNAVNDPNAKDGDRSEEETADVEKLLASLFIRL
jgi:serine protease